MKTPERAHSPAKMWERKKLSKNYAQALSQVMNHSILEEGHLTNLYIRMYVDR